VGWGGVGLIIFEILECLVWNEGWVSIAGDLGYRICLVWRRRHTSARELNQRRR